MQLDTESMLGTDRMDNECPTTDGPSVDFICAISEFLDTDPKDLLVELGYYANNNTLATASAGSEG